MNDSMTSSLVDKKLLSIMIVTAIIFSGSTFFALDSELMIDNCSSITCYTVDAANEPKIIFDQQENSISNLVVQANLEDFTDLKIPISQQTKEPVLLGNKVTLFAEKDSFIREGIPSGNAGKSEVLRLMGTGPINNRALVAFNQDDLESVLNESILESATLKLYVQSTDENWNSGQALEIHRVQTDWSEGISSGSLTDTTTGDGITWNCPSQLNCNISWNGGNFESAPTDSVFVSNQIQNGYWIKFDVTEDVNAFVSGTSNNGWIIVKSDEDSSGRINFASREAQSNGPELILVMSQ